MSSSGTLPKATDISKSLALLPKLEAAPLPDWAKKTRGTGGKKLDATASSLPGEWGRGCDSGATRGPLRFSPCIASVCV